MGEVTTPTPRPNVRLSTFALLMEPVVWPSTASCVPTEPSSTRTTSSATGGSTSTVLRLRDFTLSMTRLPPSVRPLPLLLTPTGIKDQDHRRKEKAGLNDSTAAHIPAISN